MEKKNQKMFRINLANIPRRELSEKAKVLFHPDYKISNKDYLNIDLETTWTIDGLGNEIPNFYIVAETDSDTQRSYLNAGFFGEYFAFKYQALLDIIENERLSPNDFTFFDGFEKEDIQRIFYVNMQIFGREFCLGRKHSDFLFDSLRTLKPFEIVLSDEEKSLITMDIPAEYFDHGKIPIIPGEEKIPYLSIATFKYLVNNGVLEKGTLSLENKNTLNAAEKAYIDWLNDSDSVKKPIIDFSKSQSSGNVFERIFKKSPQADLSLEF
jgi:hypothetical protein